MSGQTSRRISEKCFAYLAGLIPAVRDGFTRAARDLGYEL